MSTFDRIRINFISIPTDPCRVQASFLDSSGAVLKTAQLDLGIATTSFTFDSSDVPAGVVELEITGRLRVHVSLIPVDPCKGLGATLQLEDALTNNTLVVLSPVPKAPPFSAPDFPSFSLVNLTAASTARLNALNLRFAPEAPPIIPVDPCRVQVSFMDGSGAPLGLPVELSLGSGLGGSADFAPVSATGV